MARKIIPQSLKPQARLKYMKKDGKELGKEEEIYKLCHLVSEILDVKYEISQ